VAKGYIHGMATRRKTTGSTGSIAPALLDACVDRLNQRHAVVLLGAKTMILDERIPRGSVRFTSTRDFHAWYANDTVNGRSVSRWWLAHPRRRQYEEVVFDPRDKDGFRYNLWRGFAVYANPHTRKSCAKFLAHVKDNICAGNEEHYNWVLGWLAHMVQRPEQKPGVALVLRGKEGAGKGFFANMLGRLSPHHYVVVSQTAHLTGRFNSHHAQCLLMFVDEGFWAGDKQGEGALKHLVTDHKLLIEQKGVDAFMVRNVTRLIIASNEGWVVPAGAQARRWCVLDVDDAHACDRSYFGAIEEEMKDGGLEALMHVLETFDLSTIDVYTPPKTEALLEQKEQSMEPHEKWWLECLREGRIRHAREQDAREEFEKDGWPEKVLKDDLWESYSMWAKEHNVRSQRRTRQQLHTWLRELMSEMWETRLGGGDRKRVFILPGLDACREAFAGRVAQTIDWGEKLHGELFDDAGPKPAQPTNQKSNYSAFT
jgi:uncharacterized protein DUF5906